MADSPSYVPLPVVTCGPICWPRHTYRLMECGLSCAELHGGVADMSWSVACPRCAAVRDRPCLRLDGTAAAVSCGPRWDRYHAKEREQAATTPDPIPDVFTEGFTTADTLTVDVPIDATKLMEALASIRGPRRAPVPPHVDTKRREQYAGIIRDHIKALTIPAPTPGGQPMLGATEWDIADVVLLAADTELLTTRETIGRVTAERDAALRIAAVWQDAPDPLARAQAADLLSAIRGASARTAEPPLAPGLADVIRDLNTTPTWEPGPAGPRRLLPCGWCYETLGQPIHHPHPECSIGATPTDVTPTPCGQTDEGVYSPLGPCLEPRDHTSIWHKDARGAQWSNHPPRSDLSRAVALALHHYDQQHALSGNDTPSRHHYGEASAALTAVEEYLEIDDAQAWCKTCRRVWESRRHRCETDAEQQVADLDARLTRLHRTLTAVRRLAEHPDAQASAYVRNILAVIDVRSTVPLVTKTSGAREDFLSLCAQWGLTTGRGSREHATRILDRHAQELTAQQ